LRLASEGGGEAGLVVQLLDAFADLAPDRIVVDDRATLAAARQALARKPREPRPDLVLHEGAEDVFEHCGVADELAAALSMRVALRGGGALIVETTAAMTVIDVDCGDAVTGRGDPRAAVLAVNLAAAEMAARQIRLRNLAGAIVIDFVSMTRRADRERVGAALQAAFADDPTQPQILGWTRLGHLEIVRPRQGRPLSEAMLEPHGPEKKSLALAFEALRLVQREARANPAADWLLVVTPPIEAALHGPAAAALRALEARLGREIALGVEPSPDRRPFDIAQR